MRGILQNRTIGTMGRWGNQVFQYAALRVLAKRNDCDWQCAPWVGELITGRQDPRPDRVLPILHEKDYTPNGDGIIQNMPVVRNVDVRGYFQYRTDWYAPDRDFIFSLFDKASEDVWKRMYPPIKRLREIGPVLGIHVRATDYGRGTFFISPWEWYEAFLEKHAGEFKTIFVATEDRSFLDRIRRFSPITADDLNIERPAAWAGYNYLPHEARVSDPKQLDFYTDWELLRQCDAMLMPNSTFSFAAAWLSETCKQTCRANPDTRRFDPIDVWNAVPIHYIKQSDYAHIKELWASPDNPYWR